MDTSLPLRSPWHEAMSAGPNAPLTGGCNPGRILGRVLALDHIQLAAPPGSDWRRSRSLSRSAGAAASGFAPGRTSSTSASSRTSCRRGRRTRPSRRPATTSCVPRCPPLLRRRSVGKPDRADLSRIGRECRRPPAERASCRRRSGATGRLRRRAAPRRSRGRRSEQPNATA
jgi:hypothetical protein